MKVQRDAAPDLSSAARFRREAEIWVSLGRHPHIVPVIWVDTIDQRLVICAQYVAADAHGRVTMEDQFRVGTTIRQVAHWALEVCFALEHAFQHGVRAHRDLKPENILIGSACKAQLSDFGLAGLSEGFATGGNSVESMVAGTLRYMAPEQFGDPARVDGRVDVWALGVILYRAATGTFPHASPSASFADWESAKWTIPAVPDGPYRSVITRCLAPDPAQRYPDAAALRADLSALFRRAGVPLPQEPAPAVESASDLNNQALTALKLGDKQRALALNTQALALRADWPEALSNRGALLAELGRTDEAAEAYHHALSLNPRLARAAYNLGLIRSGRGDHAGARSCYAAAVRHEPNYVPAYEGLARAESVLGNHAAALAVAETAVQLDPHSPLAWHALGRTHASARRLPEAVTAYDRSISLGGGARARRERGLAFLRLNDHVRAWADLYEAERKGDTDSTLFHALGFIAQAAGRSAEAIAYYDQCVRLSAQAEVWFERGNVLTSLGRTEEALASYEASIGQNPREFRYWSNAAGALADLGRDREALVRVVTALQLRSDDEISWWLRAMLEARLGMMREAATSYSWLRTCGNAQMEKFAESWLAKNPRL